MDSEQPESQQVNFHHNNSLLVTVFFSTSDCMKETFDWWKQEFRSWLNNECPDSVKENPEAIKDIKLVSAARVVGHFDFILYLDAPSPQAVENFVIRYLRGTKKVRQTVTYIGIPILKEQRPVENGTPE